jgi:peptidyl-prolyl cis-trans isomerase A (cyclophilin A)
MKKKFAIILAAAAVSVMAFTGCGSKNTTSDSSNEGTEVTTEASSDVAEADTETTTLDAETQAKIDKLMQPVDELPQLEGVKAGDTIATIHTSKGDIKVWFFPEYAPKAVENFTTHAKEGYYDNLTFHRVIEGFMIQGGDPNGDGTGGESIWGEPFEVEPSFKLRHFRGALCMAKSSDPVSIGSQFYIVQNNGLTDDVKSSLEQLKSSLDEEYYDGLTVGETIWPEAVIDEYLENGGTPSLDLQYTVFGQVYEGMDVVDAIAAVEKTTAKDGAESKPVEDIIINSIEIGTYEG